MDKKFYITTPIYYPSAKPHMGHAYSSIIADFFARFKRMDGFDVQFLTGTDEHGLKIQRSAEKKNIDTLEFCNQISQTFKDLSIKYLLYSLIEIYFRKNISIKNTKLIDINNYFLKKINNTKIFNLDDETLLMEFDDRVLDG